MDKGLLCAIQDTKPWLDRFTRREYEAAFGEYCSRFLQLFQTALDNTEPEPLAEELLNAVADGWASERLWNRPTRRFSERQMMTLYLTPMLLSGTLQTFAEALHATWLRRWPKEPYEMAEYSTLAGSFRDTILGFEIRRRK